VSHVLSVVPMIVFHPFPLARTRCLCSNFIIQALQGKNITIYGKGRQTRSFQYVDDLVSGLMKLMNR